MSLHRTTLIKQTIGLCKKTRQFRKWVLGTFSTFSNKFEKGHPFSNYFEKGPLSDWVWTNTPLDWGLGPGPWPGVSFQTQSEDPVFKILRKRIPFSNCFEHGYWTDTSCPTCFLLHHCQSGVKVCQRCWETRAPIRTVGNNWPNSGHVGNWSKSHAIALPSSPG